MTENIKKRYPTRIKIQAGQVYNKLTAIAPAGHNKQGATVWLFQCECGRQCTTVASTVVKGKTRSCGCLVRGGADRQRDPITGNFLAFERGDKPGWLIAAHAVWSDRGRYSDGCPFEDFLRLTQLPCHYCGLSQASALKRKGEFFRYNGLDRKDPAYDHSPWNVVPCCKYCNYAKHTLGYEAFFRWVSRVYHFSQDKILAFTRD